jgi:hypothetical protein
MVVPSGGLEMIGENGSSTGAGEMGWRKAPLSYFCAGEVPGAGVAG